MPLDGLDPDGHPVGVAAPTSEAAAATMSEVEGTRSGAAAVQ